MGHVNWKAAVWARDQHRATGLHRTINLAQPLPAQRVMVAASRGLAISRANMLNDAEGERKVNASVGKWQAQLQRINDEHAFV